MIDAVYSKFNVSPSHAEVLNVLCKIASTSSSTPPYCLNEDHVFFDHIVPSLLLNEVTSDNTVIVDLGAGTGFPSIVLALLNPNKQIISVDHNENSLNVIKFLASNLNLSNITTTSICPENDVYVSKSFGGEVSCSKLIPASTYTLHTINSCIDQRNKFIKVDRLPSELGPTFMDYHVRTYKC